MMVQVKELVSNNLVNARKTHGWSQAFVSRQTGISIRTISRAENSQGISKYTLNQLASFYAIPVEDLYYEHKPDYNVITPIPFTMVANILHKSSFINVIQQETLCQFFDIVQEKAIMVNEDFDVTINNMVGHKNVYSYQDVVNCCRETNRKTIMMINQIVKK